MDLHHTFTVPVPPAEAWSVLTDLERIAPCLPGAELTETVDDEYRGQVKVKVGPITATYKGVARWVERDEAARRAVIRAEGRDARQGNAHATITATLAEVGEGTEVSVATDLTISGKVAQLGRGMLSEVSAKLIDQFVERLDADLLQGEAQAQPPPPDVAQPPAPPAETSPPAPSPSAPPVDLIEAAGVSVLKRLVPVGVAVLLAVIVVRRLRRR